MYVCDCSTRAPKAMARATTTSALSIRTIRIEAILIQFCGLTLRCGGRRQERSRGDRSPPRDSECVYLFRSSIKLSAAPAAAPPHTEDRSPQICSSAKRRPTCCPLFSFISPETTVWKFQTQNFAQYVSGRTCVPEARVIRSNEARVWINAEIRSRMPLAVRVRRH